MQRFFSPTTMPATDWRTPLCSHEPASTSLATRALKTRGARGIGARSGLRQAPVLKTATCTGPRRRLSPNRAVSRSRSSTAARTGIGWIDFNRSPFGYRFSHRYANIPVFPLLHESEDFAIPKLHE